MFATPKPGSRSSGSTSSRSTSSGSTTSYRSSTTGSRSLENKRVAIEELKVLYAKRDFLENILKPTNENYESLENKIIKKYSSSYINPPTQKIEAIFDNYRKELEDINKKILKLQISLEVGVKSRITNSRSSGNLPSRNIQQKYPHLYVSNIKNVNGLKKSYNNALNHAVYSPNHYGFNPSIVPNGTLNNGQLSYIDNLLGLKTYSNSKSTVSSLSNNGSTLGGAKKKRTTKKKSTKKSVKK